MMKITTTVTLLLLMTLMLMPVCAQQEESAKYVDMAPDEMNSHVIKVLRTTNKAQINMYVAKVYDFNNVNPHEVANFIANGLKLEEGGIYTFVHPDGNKGKMLVFCPKYQLPWFDQVCAELDRVNLTSAPGSKYIYYRLKNRSAADANFLAVLFNYISPNGVVFPDIETNSVLLFDSPSGAEYCEAALKEYLDEPTPQVNVDVKIYEIDLRNDGTLGLDYEMWKNGPGSALFGVQFAGRYETARYDNISFLGYRAPNSPLPDHFRYRDWYRGYGYRLEYPSAFFDFLVEKGKARVVVNTRLSSSNSEPAMLRAGDFIPFYRVVTNDRTFSRSVNSDKTVRKLDGISNLKIDLVDSGIYLEIDPLIGRDDIDLDLTARVVNHLGWSSNGEPLLSSFNLENVFTVQNGEEILIGGLTRERLINTTKKIPILGDLPVLGWLFGGETNDLRKSIVVVSLKPVIIEDFSGVTDADVALMSKATGKSPVPIPSLKVGFDQYLLDGEK